MFTQPRWHKRALLGATAATLALTMSGCGSSNASAGSEVASFEEMDKVTLKMSTLYGPENWNTTPLTDFANAVTEATEGKVNFEFYYAGSLLPAAEIAGGLKDGIIDIAQVVPVYNAATFPVDNWINTLGFVPSSSPVAGTLQGAAATMEWGFQTEEYLKDFENAGLKPILPRLQSVHTYNLLCQEEAQSLGDLAGKRVRVGGEAWSAEAINLGMVPVSMPASEVYTAFQQGLIDCFMGGAEDIAALGLTDHGKYFNAAGLTGWTSNGIMMGQDAWDDLPKIAQDALWDQLPVYLERFLENNIEANLKFVQAAEGVTFSVSDATMEAKITEHHDSVLEAAKQTPPQSVGDSTAILSSYSALHDSWLQKIEDLGYDAGATSWADYANNHDVDNIDVKAWVDQVKKDILDKHRP